MNTQLLTTEGLTYSDIQNFRDIRVKANTIQKMQMIKELQDDLMRYKNEI